MSESQRIDQRIIDQIRHLGGDGLSNRQIAVKLALDKTTVAKYRTEPSENPDRPRLSEASEQTGDTWDISLPKTRIHTLEELIAFFKVDTSIWECERFVANKWEMGYKDKAGEAHTKELYQVKAFFRKNKAVSFAKQAIDRLIKKAEKHAPKYPKIPAQAKSGVIVEIAPVDVHFGALIWGKETGGDDYDTAIAVGCYKDAISSLIARTDSFKPEKALLVLGNDQQNSDNRLGTTEAGTPQNNDSRYHKVFDASVEASIWAIDACLLKYGAVDVVMVSGNHDYLATFHLGKVLQVWYRNVPQVKIDNGPNPRKYYEHGVNMILFTHGNKGKLEDYDKTMAAEQPEMWGRTRWREAHTGDKHHRRTVEQKGATIRILPSLRPSCSWSAENHFVGAIRAAEAYVWSKAEGLVGTATYSILDKAK